MKRLDTAGSLKLSEGFVGTTRSAGSGGSDETKQVPDDSQTRRKIKGSRSKPRPPGSLAGAAIISEVVLPTLENVS